MDDRLQILYGHGGLGTHRMDTDIKQMFIKLGCYYRYCYNCYYDNLFSHFIFSLNFPQKTCLLL